MGRLYVIGSQLPDVACNVVGNKVLSLLQWHTLLGHASFTTMKHVDFSKEKCTSLEFEQLRSCEVFHKAKHHRTTFPILQTRNPVLFGLVHDDVWGPYRAENVANVSYMLTLVEDHSRTTRTYLFSSKGQVSATLRAYFNMVKTQFGKSVLALKSDNGTEFLGHGTQSILHEYVIIHQRTCVYSPQQNGVVEHKHQTLLEIARAMMFQPGLPLKFWSFSILTATWLINRLPNRILNWESPFQVLIG